MNITRCVAGHYYDSDRDKSCPQCAASKMGLVEENDRIDVPEKAPDMRIMGAQLTSVAHPKAEMPYVFVSYAHTNAPEVTGIIEYMKTNHFNLWYDEGIKSGYEWADEISRKIKHCKQFICFISNDSIQSESVKDEIHIAWKYNINIIVVYLEKVELDGGLEMKLDRKQAILKYALDEQSFYHKLSSSISQDVVNLGHRDEMLRDVAINDRYEILKVLASGGTATTYLARNKTTGVQVALKRGVYDSTVSGTRIKRSFERERDVLAKNISPFLPCLYDYFCDEHNIYLAESYIEGKAIAEMRGLSLYEKLRAFVQAAKILKALHARGIYHCDIKPEHIIVNQHGCFLIDLGSAENVAEAAPDDVKMGTVTYAAPEQFVSYNGEDDIFGNFFADKRTEMFERSIDERTDIYSLGRAIIKTLSGEESISEDVEVTTVLFADVARTLGKFSDNPLLQAIIEKMVREKKSERYRNVDEVIRVLEDFLKLYE